MAKIKNFDRPTAIAFGAELETVLAKLSKKYGITIDLKTRKYETDGSGYSAKVIVAVVGSDGVTVSKEAKDYERFAKAFGFTIKLGETFYSQGESYTVTGFNARASRMPIQAKRNRDGLGFKFTKSVVQA